MDQPIIDLDTDYINYPGMTGEVRAHLARPKGDGKFAGVVVIHENKGLDPHIEDVNKRVASQGFLSIAPDALSPLGGTPQDSDKAIALTKELDGRATLENYLAAVKYLRTHPMSTGKVAVVGFCWGGAMANQVAVNDPKLSAAIPFYGKQPAPDEVSKIKAALLLHYGGLDEKVNAGIPAFEAALKAASIEYRIYMYAGAKHAFHNDTKADRYDKAAAQLAWERTVSFLNAKLKS